MPAPFFINTRSSAFLNREHEWKQCCAVAMGFEWVDQFDEDEKSNEINDDKQESSSYSIHLINLMDDEGNNPSIEVEQNQVSTFPGKSSRRDDHWTENALRIQADLTRMARWIRSKQHNYVSLDMQDDEASLIQSTVTSFAVTTASELETLRKIIPSSSSNLSSHRNGVVQILTFWLQDQIAEPFGVLQKQRSRVAVQLWQNPLQCRLYQPNAGSTESPNSVMDQLFEGQDDYDREQRFLPRQPSPPDDYDFISKYTREREYSIAPIPDFLSRLVARKAQQPEAANMVASSSSSSVDHSSRPRPQFPIVPQKPTIIPYQQPTTEEESRRQMEEELQQEAAMLTVAVQSDLDSVQKMEQRMVEITTLISQFSNLVSEQQENIWQIHDSAEKTKENMEKGQENLVDATERTKRSKHYMAWTIFALSMTLLFFHTLRN